MKKILLCVAALLCFIGCDNPNSSDVKSGESGESGEAAFFDFIPVGYYKIAEQEDNYLYFNDKGTMFRCWGGVFPNITSTDGENVINFSDLKKTKHTDNELFFELETYNPGSENYWLLKCQFTKKSNTQFRYVISEQNKDNGEEYSEPDIAEQNLTKTKDIVPYLCVKLNSLSHTINEKVEFYFETNMKITSDTLYEVTATKDGVNVPLKNIVLDKTGTIISCDSKKGYGVYVFTFTFKNDEWKDKTIVKKVTEEVNND